MAALPTEIELTGLPIVFEPGEVVIFTIKGRLSAEGRKRISERLESVLQQRGVEYLLLDEGMRIEGVCRNGSQEAN